MTGRNTSTRPDDHARSSPVDGAAGSGLGRRAWLWAPPVLEMVAIFGLSSQAEVGPPAMISDKLAHLLAYGMLAALILRALASAEWRRVSAWAVTSAIVAATIYGVLDEWHQSFVPGRTPELADVVADASGACLAGVALWSCGIIKRSREG